MLKWIQQPSRDGNDTFAVRREYRQRTDVQHANRLTDGQQRAVGRSITDRRIHEQANN